MENNGLHSDKRREEPCAVAAWAFSRRSAGMGPANSFGMSTMPRRTRIGSPGYPPSFLRPSLNDHITRSNVLQQVGRACARKVTTHTHARFRGLSACIALRPRAPRISTMPTASRSLGSSPSCIQAASTPITGAASVPSPATPAGKRLNA
jgi:hypothetical protein